jgi:hypothetical protein
VYYALNKRVSFDTYMTQPILRRWGLSCKAAARHLDHEERRRCPRYDIMQAGNVLKKLRCKSVQKDQAKVSCQRKLLTSKEIHCVPTLILAPAGLIAANGAMSAPAALAPTAVAADASKVVAPAAAITSAEAARMKTTET